MFCMKCGTELPDDAQFCYKCGAKTAGTGSEGRDNQRKQPSHKSSSYNRQSSTYDNGDSSSRGTYSVP